MSGSSRTQPTILDVSPHETLIVFPIRPGASLATLSDLPFDAYKHLLSDRPLEPPYRGERSRASGGGTRRRKPQRKRRRRADS